MSNSSVRMICPNLRCRSILSVPIAARGKIVRCRQCGMKINVPETAKPKPAPSAPGQAE